MNGCCPAPVTSYCAPWDGESRSTAEITNGNADRLPDGSRAAPCLSGLYHPHHTRYAGHQLEGSSKLHRHCAQVSRGRGGFIPAICCPHYCYRGIHFGGTYTRQTKKENDTNDVGNVNPQTIGSGQAFRGTGCGYFGQTLFGPERKEYSFMFLDSRAGWESGCG